MKTIKRDEYLDFLIRSKDKQIIKVVSGVRRCGKSTLFEIYQDYLQKEGVDSQEIHTINFENMDYEELTDYKKLYNYLKSRLITNKMNYIFLDEIQHVDKFEKVVDSLFIMKNVDIYITGSNAFFMSGELATLLTGRYIELKMLPLSFKEYLQGVEEYQKFKNLTSSNTLLENYQNYLLNSSFPYTLQLEGNKKNINEYLQGIYSSILLKDVVTRIKVSDVMMLESIIKFLFDNIGNLFSTTKISNTMTSIGRKIDQKTVEKYLKGLTDSLILYEVNRYNIKGKNLLATLSKYYVVDIGLRQMLLGNRNMDLGHILENIVYLELLRRETHIYVGQFGDTEVDFVTISSDKIAYYQVALTVLDENTLKRELKPLEKISDNYPKFLLTLDDSIIEGDYNGIKILNAIKWLKGGE